uniref:Uncharacterized protein n=1 Tax=Plectus sambesii TaxID=2011161 RepID=A0A914WAA6_9BILA
MLLTARTMALTTLAWLTNMVLVVTAEVCTSQQPLTKSKSCPGFKDKEAEEHCCPSAIEPGTFFCCDQARLNELEQERQAAVRRAFLAKYLAWIVLGSLALLIVIVTVILTVCYKHKNCPLARRKRDRRKTQAENRAAATSSFTSRYRPVPIETIEPKPSPYDGKAGVVQAVGGVADK